MKIEMRRSKLFLTVFAIVFFIIGVLSTLVFQNILFSSYIDDEVDLAPMIGGKVPQVYCVWVPCLNPLFCGLVGNWICSDGTTRSWDDMFPKS